MAVIDLHYSLVTFDRRCSAAESSGGFKYSVLSLVVDGWMEVVAWARTKPSTGLENIFSTTAAARFKWMMWTFILEIFHQQCPNNLHSIALSYLLDGRQWREEDRVKGQAMVVDAVLQQIGSTTGRGRKRETERSTRRKGSPPEKRRSRSSNGE